MEYTSLKSFLRALVRYAGNGYCYYQISKIPEKKFSTQNNFEKKIDKSIQKKYAVNLTQGQRQHRKKQGKCNFAYLRYGLDTIVVLKTRGEDESGEKFKKLDKLDIQLKVLRLYLQRDEEGKITIKLHESYLNEIRSVFDNIVSARQGVQFREEIQKLFKLSKSVRYKPVQVQIASLLKYIQSLQKKHGTSYVVPKFFSSPKGYK